MSLTSTTVRNSYTGTGTTSVYSYTFKIFDQADLLVTVRVVSTGVETPLALTTDYTVSGVGATAGGNITLVAGVLPTGSVITIRRKRAVTQSKDIRNQTAFYASTHEDAFDHFIMIDQQQQDQIDRSVKLPETETTSVFNPTLPALLPGSASVSLVTKADGSGFDIGPTVNQINTAQSSAIAAQSYAAAALVSEGNAATSASGAAASASAAASSATGASGSATAASGSASAAAASAAAAAAAAMAAIAPVITGTRAAPQGITAAGGIAFTGIQWFSTWYIQGSGSAIVVTKNPAIAAATNIGQKLLLIVPAAASYAVTLNDGSGLDLSGPWVGAPGSALDLEFDGSNWFETGRRAA